MENKCMEIIMKKSSLKPYLDLIVVSYYILTFIMIMLFFCYVSISDRTCEQIHIKEIELQYALDSQSIIVASTIQEELNLLKIKDTVCTMNEIKYLIISSILITLIIVDIKVYNKMKGKNCWYTDFHKNRSYLFPIKN